MELIKRTNPDHVKAIFVTTIPIEKEELGLTIPLKDVVLIVHIKKTGGIKEMLTPKNLRDLISPAVEDIAINLHLPQRTVQITSYREGPLGYADTKLDKLTSLLNMK